MPEAVIVRNIARHFDRDFIRLSLYRVFSSCGVVVEVQLLDDCAVVLFQSSEGAQAAYVQRNGYPLFGSEISVMIGGASALPALKHFALSEEPTATLLVQGAEQLWMSLCLRHWKGVEECLLVDVSDTLVKCSSVETAKGVAEKLSSFRSPSGKLLTVYFVKRLRVLPTA